MGRCRRVVVAVSAGLLALGFAACGAESGKVEDPPSDAAGSSGEVDEHIAALEGRWEYQGDFPTDVAALTFDADGNAVYFTEGGIVEFEGVVEPGEEAETYVLPLEPKESPDAEGVEGFTAELSVDGESLVMAVDGTQRTFTRARGG
ncbi:MAG: hypothetical protein ACRDXX_12950 [Stackebrandtia sp.]